MEKFSSTFTIRIEDVNLKLRLSNKAFLEYMENCAERHAAACGFGLGDVVKNGSVWVLVDWKLNVLKRPLYGNEIEVKTWIRKLDSYYSFRDFEVYCGDEIIGKATSKWILIDFKSGSILEANKGYHDRFQVIEERAINEDLGRLNTLDSYEKCLDLKIRKADIDFNNHVHNLTYLDYYNELIDEELNDLRIIYKKSVKPDDEIKIYSSKVEDTYHLAIKVNDEVVSMMEGKC